MRNSKALPKNVRPIRFLYPMVLAALLGGCASPIRLHELTPSAEPWNGTAVLINYELDTQDPAILNGGCAMTLRNLDSRKNYQIELAGKRRMALFKIAPGTYMGKELSCPSFSKWKLQSLFTAPFTLAPGRINYLGKLFFRFSANEKSLETSEGNQAEVTQGLATDLSILPSSWQGFLTDPFTQAPITTAMLTPKEDYRLNIHTTDYLKKGQTAPSTQELEDELRACDLAEQRNYPYRLGTLTYTATYQGRKLQSFEKKEADTFSDDFKTCLKQHLKGFTPPSDVKLKVTVSL